MKLHKGHINKRILFRNIADVTKGFQEGKVHEIVRKRKGPTYILVTIPGFGIMREWAQLDSNWIDPLVVLPVECNQSVKSVVVIARKTDWEWMQEYPELKDVKKNCLGNVITKIQAIKTVREITSLGLKEAKDLVETW